MPARRAAARAVTAAALLVAVRRRTDGRLRVPIARADKVGYSLKTVFDRVPRQLFAADLGPLAQRGQADGTGPEHLADGWLESHGCGPAAPQDSAG